MLARHQQRKDFEVARRLLPCDLLNRLLAVLAEVQQQRLHELLVQQMTRVVPVTVRVDRHPWPERHAALHVRSLVLIVSKYLIRLPNTSGKAHQRVWSREVGHSSLVVPTIGRGGQGFASATP